MIILTGPTTNCVFSWSPGDPFALSKHFVIPFILWLRPLTILRELIVWSPHITRHYVLFIVSGIP